MTDRATWRLVSAGVGVVAVGYGLARYGYGLLLPDMRAAFGLSSGLLGLIAGGAYVSYLAAVAAAGLLSQRLGARTMVLVGGVVGVAGMAIIASASGPAALALGVVVAGASGGLVFPPFADVVETALAPRARSRALAMISSGTGWGVMVSAPVALLVGGAWRLAWVAFLALGVLATLWAARTLPARPAAQQGSRAPARLSPGWFVCPRSGPLLVGALFVGIGASVYWTFAVDLASQAGGLGRDGARVILGVVGAASILGSFGGDLLERLGGRAALILAALGMAGALALLAAAPGSWPTALASAVVFGAAYNLLVAVQTIWSARVFAQRPATGLAAVMFILSIGLLVGAPLAGALADRFGLTFAFYAAAASAAVAALLPPREDLRAAPVARPSGA